MSLEAIPRYPLQWPQHLPRKTKWDRRNPSFGKGKSIAAAATYVLKEVRLMQKAARVSQRDPIISSNLQLRKDGIPYSNQAQPDDVGVAVYFWLGQKPVVFACDSWSKVEYNLIAIAVHIESMRRAERTGVGSWKQAFKGYELPRPGLVWYEVLECSPNATLEEAEKCFRDKAKLHHPDVGGNPEVMKIIRQAILDRRNME